MHTGSMEAMSDAGGAQKRPALRGGPSLARGGVAPWSHSPALLPRRALPRSQIWASQLYRLFRDGPLAHLGACPRLDGSTASALALARYSYPFR